MSRLRSLIVLTVLAAAVGVAGYRFDSQTTSEPNPGRFYLRNSGGAVLFEHRLHTILSERCESCHHDILFADSRNPCTDCHTDSFAVEGFSHAELKDIDGHECASCHQVNQKREIRSCRSCHPESQEEAKRVVSCDECHENGYTADMLGHDEMQDIKGHECSSCHVTGSVSKSYHLQCNRCHLSEYSEKFAGEKGEALCYRCHLQ